MPKLTFQSDVSWSGEGVRSIAQIGDRQVVIDEPKSLGGTDQGPNPVEYLLAALGGCISILVSMFADRHKVELKGVKVHVEGDLDPDGFMKKIRMFVPDSRKFGIASRLIRPLPLNGFRH